MDRPEFEDLIYVQEVKTQCTSALFALEQFNRCIEEFTQPEGFDDCDTPSSEVFRALHSLLTHAANVSRLLFPTRSDDKYAQQRGQRLRDWLRQNDVRLIRSKDDSKITA